MVFKDILLVILGQLSSVTVFRLLFLPVSSVLVLWVLIWLSVLCLESLCKRLVTLSDYRPFCLRALIGEHESVCVCVFVCACVALVFSLENLTESAVRPFVVAPWRGLGGSGFECELCQERYLKEYEWYDSRHALHFCVPLKLWKGTLTWFLSGCCFRLSGSG